MKKRFETEMFEITYQIQDLFFQFQFLFWTNIMALI